MERGMERSECVMCGGEMHATTVSKVLKAGGHEIEIKGIQAYKCENCGEIVYKNAEVKMIERIMDVINEKQTTDVFNLDETAEYLRVSKQTIYNMIRDGRLKACKVGREWRFLKADVMIHS